MDVIYSLDEISSAAKKILSLSGENKVIAFYGAMGTGKTTLIKSICQQLGVTDNISSPTYSIIHQYQASGFKTINHIDLYRLKDREEVINAGVEDCIYSGDLSLIEWPERFFALLPLNTVSVIIEMAEDKKRKLVIKLP
ncbi:MAG: tRNA (adenosine(37)-N6)-threonylcarbamoyltransferase complex ATPase subunit type 1 TsaE [Chitinophagaceae bacterium]|nr:tRNA (adenosine(37)-N6)-threonylcarbamoyltransferase complex ATPase subunit type 1 TsaE [Chitinophagaceae bacterium]